MQNAKDAMIDHDVRHETYSQAKAANWPRPTCRYCHGPTAYDDAFIETRLCQSCYKDALCCRYCDSQTVADREFKATGLCQRCYKDRLPPLTTQPKELLHVHQRS